MDKLMMYKCPQCGGAVKFDSDLQKVKCPYCETEFEVEIYDESLNVPNLGGAICDPPTGSEWKEGEAESIRVYACRSCGGEIIADENTVATMCPYCNSHVAMVGQLSGDLRPDYIIPFKLNRESAEEGLKNHLSGRSLISRSFKKHHSIDDIKGVYIPFWLFDADASGTVEFYVKSSDDWHTIRVSGSVGFENIPVDGSKKIPDDLMESIEPFKFSDAKDFQTAYLAGYLADRYDVTPEESVNRANTRIKRSVAQLFRQHIDEYLLASEESSRIFVSNAKAKYALYPVWLLNIKWRGKKYMFAMNGQTGKVAGNMPINRWMYWLWWLFYAVIFSIAVYFAIWAVWLYYTIAGSL